MARGGTIEASRAALLRATISSRTASDSGSRSIYYCTRGDVRFR
jgi:hypothetical protein